MKHLISKGTQKFQIVNTLKQFSLDSSNVTIFSLPSELEDEDIIAQVLLFFLAGFDTASTLLCFASHQLAVHLEVQARLQQEIDETLQENGRKLTYEALHNMKYLDMVVNGERNNTVPLCGQMNACQCGSFVSFIGDAT
jgi:deoxycytidine triphosphate deaminase